MKTSYRSRRGRLFDLVGALSLLWWMSLEEGSDPEEDYSFFDDPLLG